MNAQAVRAGMLRLEKQIFLYLVEGEDKENREVLKLLDGLEKRGFAVNKIYATHRPREMETPWLIDPQEGPYYGVDHIKHFVTYKLNELSRSSGAG